MVDKTLSALLTTNPVTSPLTGEEPVETVKSGTSEAFKTRQLSAAPIAEKAGSANLLLTDQGKVVEMASGSANTLTVKVDAVTDLPVGATLLVRQTGAGVTTIAFDGGITVLKRASLTLVLAERHAQIVLHKTAANTWHTTGEYLAV